MHVAIDTLKFVRQLLLFCITRTFPATRVKKTISVLLVTFMCPCVCRTAASHTTDAPGGSLPADYDCSQEKDYTFRIEDLFGSGNITGITGNSALTAGFGYAGELTMLRWPSPSYSDHVCYLTPIPILSTTCKSDCECRKLPHNGAKDTMGSFAGIYYEIEPGHGQFSWFRDPSWTHSQHYRTPESNVFVTRSENPVLGLTVETSNFIHPDKDVLVRHYSISKFPDSVISSVKVFYYENMEPVTQKTPYLPIQDWVLESFYDFAVMYYSVDDALLHFRPQVPRVSSLPSPDSAQEDIDRCIERLDDIYPFDPGRSEIPIYLAIGADFSGMGGPAHSDAHQCGLQWLNIPLGLKSQSAFYDSLDGNVQGNSAMSGNVDAVLVKEVQAEFTQASFTVYVTAANRAEEALDILRDVKAEGWESLLMQTEKDWSDWMNRAKMPKTDDPDILAVCKRALVSLRQSWDKHTGAFVASVASQPPYHLSWPRDGVYCAHAMDVAGFPEIAQKELQFLAEVQRDCQDPTSPHYDIFCKTEWFYRLFFAWRFDGTYDMCYYADGVPGGPVFYEIDNAGLAAWGMSEHYHFLDAESGRRYLCGNPADPDSPGIYQAIRRTAISLANCIKPGDGSGLQCLASEGDSVPITQTLTGAASVFMALDAALQAGEVCGEDPAQIEIWKERKENLSDAIDFYFWDPTEGRYVGNEPYTDLLWPARFPMDEKKFESYARYLFSFIKAHLNKEETETYFIGKPILALLQEGWDTGDPIYNLRWATEVLLKEVPTPGTFHYGETFLAVDLDGDGDKEFINRVAIPDLWEASLAYLSAMAYYGPAVGPAQPPKEEAARACGCSVLPAPDNRHKGNVSDGINLFVVILPYLAVMCRKFRGLRKTLSPVWGAVDS